MKILCVSSSYWPAFQHGGPIHSVHGLNKAMSKKGVDITVYTTDTGLDKRIFSGQRINQDNINVVYFKYINILDFFGRTGWQFSPFLTEALEKNIKNFDLLYIIGLWNYPVSMAAYLCRKYDKPYVLKPGGSIGASSFIRGKWKKYIYYSLIAKKNIQNASAIHFTSEYEKKCAVNFLKFDPKNFVIQNALDAAELADLPPKDALSAIYPVLKNSRVLLFLGRLHPIKGLDLLVRAYTRLAEEYKDIYLVIAGHDQFNYRVSLEKIFREKGLSGRVVLTGMLTGRDRLTALSGSDVFIQPSYYESLGMSALEAMAAGVPVVISDKMGISKMVNEHKAGIVVKTDEQSLYEGIKTLLENRDLASEISANGKNLVFSEYNIEKVSDMMMDAFNDIVKNKYFFK